MIENEGDRCGKGCECNQGNGASASKIQEKGKSGRVNVRDCELRSKNECPRT